MNAKIELIAQLLYDIQMTITYGKVSGDFYLKAFLKSRLDLIDDKVKKLEIDKTDKENILLLLNDLKNSIPSFNKKIFLANNDALIKYLDFLLNFYNK